MKPVTISAGYAQALLEYAVHRGADRRQLLRRAGTNAQHWLDHDRRVPFAGYLALLNAAVELCADPALALHFGATVGMPDVTIVGLIGGSCATVEEARVQTNRYSRLIMDASDIGPVTPLEVVRERGSVWMAFQGSVYRQHPCLIETIMAQSICGARALFANTPYFKQYGFPRAIHFMHAPPAYRAEYDRIFGVPIVFNARRNAMLTDEEFLTLKLPSANRYLFGLLTKQADTLVQGLQDTDSLRGQIEAQLLPILHKGAVRIEPIAASLGMSRQTLFRKLRSEGVSFTQILDDLRHRMAVQYLDGKQVSVNEVAYLVGFSEPAAFSRAFKRWTGRSPQHLAKR